MPPSVQAFRMILGYIIFQRWHRIAINRSTIYLSTSPIMKLPLECGLTAEVDEVGSVLFGNAWRNG